MARRLKPLPLLLALFLAGGAQGQSLQELYEAARAFDATYLASRRQAESVQYAAAQAQALRLPNVGLSTGAQRREVDPPASQRDPSGSRRGATTAALSVDARQPLFNRENAATIEQADKQLELAAADLETAEQDLIIRVSQAYFDVLAAQDTLGTARANRTAITEQLASARRNFEVGTATITDTREAQARFDLATAQELQAENDLLTRRIALDQLVGRANVQPNPLAAPVVLPTVTPGDVEEWVRSADAQHPNVRRAQLGLDIAQLETEKARAGHLPTVDLVGSAGLSNSRGSFAEAQGSVGTTKDATVGVQLNLPLFAGYAIQNRVRETLVLEERARSVLDAARRGVAIGTRQAFAGVQSLQAQVKALEAAESSSRLALEATQLGYRVGVRVNLDVLNAQSQLYQAQRDLARARYDALLTSLRLEQAAGQLGPDDVAAINRVLAP
jgi:outer membrane protein